MLMSIAERETTSLTPIGRVMLREIAERESKRSRMPKGLVLDQLEDELRRLKSRIIRSRTSKRNSEHDPIIPRIEYVLDLLLPPSRASDAMLDLEEVYDRRWLPKYGLRAARLIFASQAAGLIWSFHSQRIMKWLGGALGLMKLYSWFSGPRGG
jgi:hypothetical protein